MGRSTDEQRSEHRERADDAHRRLLSGATVRRTELWLGAPTRCERVIVGGGLAATLAWATRSRTEGTCLVLARAEEPWWSRRQHRLGQPVSELVSEGFVLQPHDFGEDVDGFAPASALADAIAVTAHERGMPLVLGCCVDRPIERTEDGRFVVWVGERRIEAERVDVAVGLGPARRLRDRDGNATIVSEEDERLLLADGRLVCGEDQWQEPVRGPRVLVIGGGATAAWNVELALQHGAEVIWVAPVSASKHLDPSRLKARQLAKHLEDHPELDAERRRWLERTRARIVAFRGADLPRNREVFRSSGVDWWVGLRCLGVLLRSSAWKEQLHRLYPPVSDEQEFLDARLALQAKSAPRHSKGIDGAVFQVSANVVLANGSCLDPGLGHERHALLMTTLRSDADQSDIATSSGDGG